MTQREIVGRQETREQKLAEDEELKLWQKMERGEKNRGRRIKRHKRRKLRKRDRSEWGTATKIQ